MFDYKNPHWNDPIFPWIFIFTTSPTVLLTKFALEIVKKNSVVSLKDIECAHVDDGDCVLNSFLYLGKKDHCWKSFWLPFIKIQRHEGDLDQTIWKEVLDTSFK